MTQTDFNGKQIADAISEFIYNFGNGRFFKDFFHLDGLITCEGKVKYDEDGDLEYLDVEVRWSDNDDTINKRCYWIERILEGRL